MSKTLREHIKYADENNIAIGHFNISNIEMLHGIYSAARKISISSGNKIPIIIGLSENEEEFVGKNEAESLIESIRKKDNYPIFLNADHHYSVEKVKEALDAGYDSAIIDAVKLSFEENITITKECVSYADEMWEEKGIDVLIEAELGFIGTSSKLLDELPDGVSKETMTTPEEAREFVKATKVDLLAPSVGNVHGMIKTGNPKLDIERIKEIRVACGVPLVLHGGSGIDDTDIKEAIKSGISIIHVNTEIRVAYKDALEKYLKENPNEIAPYKYLKNAEEAVEKVVLEKIKLFNNL